MGEHVFRSASLFCGGGGMAYGTKQAVQRFREHTARFELCGAYDFDAFACQVYGYLTGSPAAQLDARTVTPGDIRKLLGEEPPDAVWISAPCKGSSKLLSSAKARTEKYVAMNDLSYRGVLTLLDAYADSPPAYLIFENVPNITTRAKKMLKALRALLRSRGYVIHDGFHEARHIGDLAQRRKRWFMVARLPAKVPVFLYRPPHKAGKVCGDVLGPLPLPNDPEGGPMHRLSDTSTINLLRLWAIPAGGDWRDLIPDGRPRRERFRRHHVERWTDPSITVAGTGSNGPCGVADPRPEQGVELARQKDAFHHVDNVTRWDEATGTVTAGASQSNGAPSVADPRLLLERARPGFTSMDHVLTWDAPSRTVTGATRPGNGAPSVADPRPLDLVGGAIGSEEERRRWEREGVKTDGQTSWFNGKYGVTPWGEPARTVIGAGAGNGGAYVADPRLDLSLPPETRNHVNRVTAWDDATGTVTHSPAPSSGAPAAADPRLHLVAGHAFKDAYGVVMGAEDPAATITAEGAPSTGRFAYAAPVPPELRPQAGNGEMHWGKYVVVPWNGTAPTVTTASRVGSGAPSVADTRIPLATDTTFRGRWGVLSPSQPAATVTGNARLHTGPFSYAAPPPQPVNLVPDESCYDAGYGVLSPDQPSRTIAGKTAVGCGAYAIADDVPRPIDLTPQGVQDNPERAARYGVLRLDEPSRTITATTRVGCGAFAVADDVPAPVDLGLGCAPHAGAYGVTPFDRESATITAHHKVDNRPAAVADPRPAPPPYVVLSHEETRRIVDGEVAVPFAIVDPERPGEPLAIVDSLKRPPFRWVERVEERVTKRGKVSRRVRRARETVALVLISADGTWHRPLTTLELAVLQAFPAQHRGQPLDFGTPPKAQKRKGRRKDRAVTAQREIIGNAVPPAVARAMAEQKLLSLLVSRTVGFALGDPGTPVWVKNVRALERQLRAEGYVVVKGRRPMNFTTGEVLDDGATIWRRSAKKRPKKKAPRRASAIRRAVHLHLEAAAALQ